MRHNVARRRTTLVKNPSPTARKFFFLRHDGVLDWGRAIAFVFDCVIQLVVVSAVVAVTSLLPTNGWLLTHVYLPVELFLAVPWIARVTKIPLALFVVAAALALSATVGEFTSRAYPPTSAVLSIMAMMVAWPLLLCAAMSIKPEQSRRWSCFGLLILALASVFELLKQIPGAARVLHFAVVAGWSMFGYMLVRSFAMRLAASPDVPAEAAIRLIDWARRLWEKRRCGKFSRVPWLLCFAASVIGGFFAGRFLDALASSDGRPRLFPEFEAIAAWLQKVAAGGESARLLGEIQAMAGSFVRRLEGLDWHRVADLTELAGSSAQFFLSIAVLMPPLLSCVSLRCMPWTYLIRSVFGLVSSFALWRIDRHPLPGGPGIYVVAHVNGRPLRLRGSSVLVLWVLGTFVFIARDAVLGLAHFERRLQEEPLLESSRLVLAVTAMTAAYIAFFLLAACGPWFAYFKYVIRGARSDASSSNGGKNHG